MKEDEIISLLSMLAKAPSLVKKVLDNGFDTEFGLIETDCLGACLKITLFNNTIVTVDILQNRQYVDELFAQIRKESEEFGINILRQNMQRCSEVLNEEKQNRTTRKRK